MISLVELMNTKYVCNALAVRLDEALHTVPDGSTVDVGRVKFGPGAYVVITNHMKRLNFVNTGDKTLNNILQEQHKDLNGVQEPTLELPEISSFEDIVSYVKSLPSGLPYYKWELSLNRDVLNTIVACIIARPDLVFDISNMYVEVFKTLQVLGCPKSKNLVYVSVLNRNYVQPTQPEGTYISAPIQFGMSSPIDLENPDESHMFYRVVCGLRDYYKEEEYESFVDAVKKII